MTKRGNNPLAIPGQEVLRAEGYKEKKTPLKKETESGSKTRRRGELKRGENTYKNRRAERWGIAVTW